MEFQVLGPIQVADGGALLSLGGPKQQAILGLLVADAGRVVSTDRLVDEIWGESPPPAARKSAQAYVARLRQAVNVHGELLRGAPPGYVLDVDDDAVDALVFEHRLTEGGRHLATDPRAALKACADALALWRGRPYGDLADECPRLRVEARRLAELRLVGLEQRNDAALAVGDDRALVPELERLVAEHPLRERFWAQLMEALNRSGRQADALRAFQRLQRTLAEIGLEPSPGLRSLEQRILLHAGGARPSPPLPAGNLPERVSSFVGRAAELREVAALIGGHRLVTVTGMGGVGKSSLAVEAARSLGSAFSGGTWRIDLSAVHAGGLAPAISRGLGVRAGDGEADLAATIDHLRRRHLLVLFDNCERVAGALAEMVEQLLTGCRRLHVLATSRGALSVDGEAQFRVMPLAVPGPGARSRAVLDCDAARLFRERAALVGRDAEVTIETAATVARICRRLEGIPLAIEIAAARLQATSVTRLAAELDDRLGVLVSRSRTAPQRHRTLRGTLDWSYELLVPPAQTLLPRLSVFDGGFTAAAAAAVCADRALHRADVGAALGELVHTSVVQVAPSAEPVYRLLDVVREYAAARLPQTTATRRLRRRYRRYVAERRQEEFGRFLRQRIAAQERAATISRRVQAERERRRPGAEQAPLFWR